MADRVFSKEELAEYDGQDGAEAYVAYRGKVYDVTDSFMWPDGQHESEHLAGRDLSESMGIAPHGDEVMKDFPVVGTLASD
ncbi:MAG TPA: cytochrome b5 domain-containing protein [Thermoleophilia bacterium]|nr:cytochrome b5 domain-containing protein [Thermoleophilia bacterium]